MAEQVMENTSSGASYRDEARGAEYTHFRDNHDEAFLYIDLGLNCDAQNQSEQAVVLYTKGLRCIELALEACSSPDLTEGPQKEKVAKMKAKMLKSKEQIESRKDYLLANDAAAARAFSDPPPSYEMSMETSPAQSPTSLTPAQSMVEDQDATMLFCIPDGVQIFFISQNGSVSAPSYPSALTILSFNQTQAGATNLDPAPAFLRVGDWSYPLIPDRSPVLRADWGAYIFPDVSSTESGCSVGVIIPDTLDREERAFLDDLFSNLTEYRKLYQSPVSETPPSIDNHSCRSHAIHTPAYPPQQSPTAERAPPARPPPPRPAPESAQVQQQPGTSGRRASETISKGIVTGAEWLAWGLKAGAAKTTEYMKKGGDKLQEKLEPEQKPTEVDPMAKKSLYYARQAAVVTCKVSGFVVKGLGTATMALGRELAPHIRKQGEKLLPDSVKKQNNDGRSKIDDVVEVAVGGLKGFGTVFNALEEAGKVLAVSLANETVKVVKHKYGDDAGGVTEDGLFAAGGAAYTAYNVSLLGVKAIAKRAAKDAARATVEDHHEDRNLPKRPRGPDDDDDGDDMEGQEKPLPPKT